MERIRSARAAYRYTGNVTAVLQERTTVNDASANAVQPMHTASIQATDSVQAATITPAHMTDRRDAKHTGRGPPIVCQLDWHTRQT